MKIFVTAVIKGGTGKTTTCAALAQAAVHTGKRVLAIDLDPQANLTLLLGGNPNVSGTAQLLDNVVCGKCTQHTEQGLGLISGNPELEVYSGKATKLYNAIQPIKEEYDYIFVDTPPTNRILIYNALYACTDLVIPLETDNNSIQGLYQIMDIVKQVNEHRETPLNVAGVVITRYDNRANLNRFIRDAIENTCNELNIPFLGCIRPSIAIREAQAMQKSIYDYAQKCNSAIDYLNIYTKIQ